MRESRLRTEVPSGEYGNGVLDFRDRPVSERHKYDVRVQGMDQIFEVSAFNQLTLVLSCGDRSGQGCDYHPSLQNGRCYKGPACSPNGN